MSASATFRTLFNKDCYRPTVTDNKTKMQSGLCGTNVLLRGWWLCEFIKGGQQQNRVCGRGCDGVISGCWCWPAHRRPGLPYTAATTSLGPADGAETSQRWSSSANTQVFHSDTCTLTSAMNSRILAFDTSTSARWPQRKSCSSGSVWGTRTHSRYLHTHTRVL